MRIIGGSLLVTCLLVGTGAALAQMQLPHQVAATLKPIASSIGQTFSQLPSALSARILNLTPQLPSRTQFAAAATSFTADLTQKIRNLFCRWLARENATVAVEISQQHPQSADAYRATLPRNVKQPSTSPPPSPTGDATTTSQVVVSSASLPASNPKPTQQTVITQPIIERVRETVRTVIQGGISEALLDSRLLALTDDLTSRMNSLSNASSARRDTVPPPSAEAI